MSETFKEYLGDAVYAEFDGYQIWLTTGDGNNQRIALEPFVFHKLVLFEKNLRAHFAKATFQSPGNGAEGRGE